MSLRERASNTLLKIARFTSRGSVIAVVVLAVAAIIVNTTGLDEGWLGLLLDTSVLNFALRAAVPLTLGGLCGILCERSGIINIGIEGMMLAGAFGAFVVKISTASLPLWLSLTLAIIAGLASGGLLGLLHAVLSIRFKVNQIISGTAIVTLAAGLTTYLFNPAWSSSGKLSQLEIPLLSKIPVLGDLLFTNGLITYSTLALVIFLQVMIFRSRWGLRTRAVGEHPRAADTMGINVNKRRYINTTLGGVVAGLAGAFLVLEAVGQFTEGMSAGRGYIALAAMIFGNWSPIGTFGASLLFGYTQGVLNGLLLAGVTTFPRQFLSMLPYVVTIVVLAGFVGRTRAPAAEGEVYETE